MKQGLSRYYDLKFYEKYADSSLMSAQVMVPIVNQIVQPRSVLDLGCGLGGWLAEWINQGVTDVVGIDGPHVDASSIYIDQAQFRSGDLRNPLSLDRKFDLVESLEVAEHLDEAHANQFVRSLAQHADIILFSAAIPGQRGNHHVNSQWPSYWIARFSEHGFKVYDVIRPLVWSDSRVEGWYRQNTFLFSRVRSFESSGTLVDIVHPQIWEDRLRPGSLTLRELARSVPGATRSAARSVGQSILAKLSR